MNSLLKSPCVSSWDGVPPPKADELARDRENPGRKPVGSLSRVWRSQGERRERGLREIGVSRFTCRRVPVSLIPAKEEAIARQLAFSRRPSKEAPVLCKLSFNWKLKNEDWKVKNWGIYSLLNFSLQPNPVSCYEEIDLIWEELINVFLDFPTLGWTRFV